jgi:hypothetical protein
VRAEACFGRLAGLKRSRRRLLRRPIKGHSARERTIAPGGATIVMLGYGSTSHDGARGSRTKNTVARRKQTSADRLPAGCALSVGCHWIVTIA